MRCPDHKETITEVEFGEGDDARMVEVREPVVMIVEKDRHGRVLERRCPVDGCEWRVFT